MGTAVPLTLGLAMSMTMATVGCTPEDGDHLGESQLAVSGLVPIVDHAPSLGPITNLSTAWIPTYASAGNILSAFTVNQTDAAYAVMQPTGWYTGLGTATAARWDQGAVWPVPSNFCESYDCPGGDLFDKYSAAPVALSTGDRDVAAIVATTTTFRGGNAFMDVAVVTSIDGGQTFTDSRLITTGASWGSEFIEPGSVYATRLITAESGSQQDGAYSAPLYVVWKSGGVNQEWWVTKLLVDPTTGFISVLNEPKAIPIYKDAGTVTIQAWERWQDGFETIAFLWSELRDRNNMPLASLPACPTDEPIEVTWKYRRATGFFEDDTYGYPNWVAGGETIDSDDNWKPCVGRSPTGGPAPHPNSDRAEMAVNRAWPWIA